ncbi:hypothetical protein KKI24_09800 [bacterium]|nr:hypothetical protein [bacterium]
MDIYQKGTRIRLDPADEYMHPLEAARNFNESMYFNIFDASDKPLGGWFRIGNRPNEGYAEMTCCLYLPDGSVGFAFDRPKISNNDALAAGGMRFQVIEPFKQLRVEYEGQVCLMKNPHQMADPKQAFTDNPLVDCRVDIEYTGVSPMFGGEPVNDDGSPIEQKASEAFARGHYEQHIGGKGSFHVDGREYKISGYGLRDHSWGPRYWQNIYWYRWLPMNFGPDFAMMVSIITQPDGTRRKGGMVLRDNEYVDVQDVTIDTVWDSNDFQKELVAHVKTAEREYRVEGRVLSLIPLRNRRKTSDGEGLVTRITEGMTEYRCDDRIGYGMSEYLDQIVDGKPVGKEQG